MPDAVLKRYIVWAYAKYEGYHPTGYDTLEECKEHVEKINSYGFHTTMIITEVIRTS